MVWHYDNVDWQVYIAQGSQWYERHRSTVSDQCGEATEGLSGQSGECGGSELKYGVASCTRSVWQTSHTLDVRL